MQIPQGFESKAKFIREQSTSDHIINVEVELLEKIKPSERGKILLDLEDAFCEINKNVRVWHTPLGDKNSLRNLRGVN